MMQFQAKEMTGQRFGRLVVLSRAPNKRNCAAWNCQCDCGNIVVARGHTMRDGRTRSCGCLAKEITAAHSRKHGGTAGGGFSPEYRSYRKMRERCLDENHAHYANYGGRGISICPRWLDGFENFIADMGSKPTTKHTIDRIDGNGPYSPENCRWATRKEQNRNARHVRAVERSDGVRFSCAGEAAEAVGGTANGLRAAAKAGRQYRGYGWQIAGLIEVAPEELARAAA